VEVSEGDGEGKRKVKERLVGGRTEPGDRENESAPSDEVRKKKGGLAQDVFTRGSGGEGQQLGAKGGD